MTIGRKFALWVVYILIAVSAVAAYVFYTIELRGEKAKLDLFGRMEGRIIEENLITFMQKRDNPGLNKKLDDVKKNAETISRILLLNRDGVVKAATDKELINKKFGIYDVGCRECHKSGSLRFSVYEGSAYRWASPIENKPACHVCHLSSVKNNGVLLIDFSVAEFKQHVGEELLGGFVIFGSSIVLMGIIMVLLSRALITRRLERLGAAMKDFQRGGTSAFAPVEGRDEITHLETGFNEMAEAIQRRENEKESLVRQLSATNEDLLKEVSLRARWEVMLREQKKFTDDLISNSAVATFVIDADHKIILWNKACEELTGFRAADMIGTSDQWKPFYPHKRQTLSDVVVDGNNESLSALYNKHARSTLTPDGLQAEGWYKSLNNKERYIIFDASPIYDGEGTLIAVNETLQDITESKRWERMLQEQLQFLQRLIDTIPIPVFYKDTDGVYQGCNKAFETYLGRPRDEIIGKTVYNMAPQELADKYEGMDRALFANPGVQVYEYSVKHADGTMRGVIFNKATYNDAQGNVAGLLGVMHDITERKRLEQKLAQSESHLRAVIDTEPECVKLIAADGTLLEMNPAGLAMIEADSLEQVAGLNICPLVASEYRPAFEALSERTFRGESGILEFEIVGLKGTRRWLETHSAPLRNARGEVYALLGVTRDITERKRAVQVIQRNYDTQAAINWVLHISLEDIPLEAILKQSLDLMLSIPWLSFESKGSIFLVESDPNKLVMQVQRGLSGSLQEVCDIVPFGKCLCGRAAARGEVQFADGLDERHEIRYEGISPHGHYCVPIMHAKTVLGVLNMYLKEGHLRDEKEIEFLSAMASALAGIIQRKRAESEREKLIGDQRNVLKTLSHSHKEWQDTFDSITDLILIVDKDFTILKANRAFSAYYGLRPQDVINKKCYELIHDGDSPIPNCPHRTTLAERKLSGEEIFDKRTKRTFSIFTFPYHSPDGETIGSIHVMRDITDDKEREMRLITSERLAALGQMASGIAHEINNPLASIAGCSEGLLSRVKKGQYDKALFESYLGIIQEEVFRCKSITTAMLSFVRKTTYEKQNINLAEALDKTLEIIGFQGRLKNIEIIRTYHEPTPVIKGNGGELRQVILAVITNALDAMNDKGTLTIETDSLENGAIIRISDTGEGISPEISTRIFDPFFTTKSERGGTGLGLSIARKIVANHNGHIDASSTPGGTTFTITLPQ